MPLLVDGTEIPESWIVEEVKRVQMDPRFRTIPDSEREEYLREAAEYAAVSRALVQMASERDERPVPDWQIEAETERIRRAGNCKAGLEALTREQAYRSLRIKRIVAELTASAPRPTEAELESFYTANRDNFRRPGTFQAAHILKNVNESQTEEHARSGIETALAELERGEDFATVADRHSDCKGNGGDLGFFAEGVMVEEFDRALRGIQPGQRTGIFSTAFGFHIAELRAWTPGGPALFEDVKEDIEKVLFGMGQRSAFQDGIERLRAKATVIRT